MTIGFVERVMYLRGMRALNLYFFLGKFGNYLLPNFPQKTASTFAICHL